MPACKAARHKILASVLWREPDEIPDLNHIFALKTLSSDQANFVLGLSYSPLIKTKEDALWLRWM